MYCPKCGSLVDDGALRCPVCDRVLNADEKVVVVEHKQEETSTLGTCALVFSVLGGWLGLVLSIIGLCTYKKKENRKKCKIGLGIFIAWVVFYIILIAAI